MCSQRLQDLQIRARDRRQFITRFILFIVFHPLAIFLFKYDQGFYAAGRSCRFLWGVQDVRFFQHGHQLIDYQPTVLLHLNRPNQFVMSIE